MAGSQSKRGPWEKARDEALDEMAGQQYYEWADIQVAVDEVVRRWRHHESGTTMSETGTGRGACNECESLFALYDVDPDKMVCPECGSRNWVNIG